MGFLLRCFSVPRALLKDITPTRPPGLDPLAVEILERLREWPEANDVVLGGHLALKHYLDYRTTHDIDAWWAQESTLTSQRTALERLRDIVKTVAAERGLTFAERVTRSMTSLEMQRDAKTVFSVQIADRDVELASPVPGPWHPVRIESLRDNIASKLTALVERGAPRDFTDIHAVIAANILSIDEAWALWQQRNPRLDLEQAKAQVLKHLESIAARRPLDALTPEQRETVGEARRWVREELTRDPARERQHGREDRGLEFDR